MNVDVLVYDGFDELDGIAPYEVFDHAFAGALDDVPPNEERDDSHERDEDSRDATTIDSGRVRYVTLDEHETVTASHGTRIGVDGALPEPTAATAPDLLAVPGGGWRARDEEASAWAEAQRGDIPDVLARYHDAGVTIASVCTGSMLLAEAGVTDGRRAVTHASALDELRESGARVVDARVVDDGDLITAGGITAGIDLALYLVERELGASIAQRVATVMEYERRDGIAGRE
ncbi:DJ-1/PfpI family protein [Halorubrum laminariae]|uniref:DJ-1/PfpI family protein n=1 Tax=Halorubrum laminariae TaxID=1433523 RepID=A0ABD6BX61_9EURY|nr:DJ-1/PfpI family protein [Halorubrum laminariae]